MTQYKHLVKNNLRSEKDFSPCDFCGEAREPEELAILPDTNPDPEKDIRLNGTKICFSCIDLCHKLITEKGLKDFETGLTLAKRSHRGIENGLDKIEHALCNNCVRKMFDNHVRDRHLKASQIYTKGSLNIPVIPKVSRNQKKCANCTCVSTEGEDSKFVMSFAGFIHGTDPYSYLSESWLGYLKVTFFLIGMLLLIVGTGFFISSDFMKEVYQTEVFKGTLVFVGVVSIIGGIVLGMGSAPMGYKDGRPRDVEEKFMGNVGFVLLIVGVLLCFFSGYFN